MAEAEVGAVFTGGDALVSLGHDVLHAGFGHGDAVVAGFDGVAVSGVEHHVALRPALVQRVEGQEAEEVVRDVEVLGDDGGVPDILRQGAGALDEGAGLGHVGEDAGQHAEGVVRQGAGDLHGLHHGRAGLLLPAGLVVDVLLELLAGVEVEIKLRILAYKRGGEGVHADQAALHLASERAHHLVALEHFRIALIHALRDGGMLTDTALGQAAVHAIVIREDEARGVEKGVAAGGQDAHALALLQGGNQVLIGLSAPVGTGSVTAVVADIERLVALRGLGVADLVELV